MVHTRSLRRSRSAIASVLGMLFLVAIVCTTVVPLFLYVNNVNNLYNHTDEEMREFDRERSLESLAVYTYPIENGSALNIHIRNKSSLNVKVVRIWIAVNETYYVLTNITALEDEIPPATEATVSEVGLPPGEKIVKVKVATSRGNVFVSETNPMYIWGESWGPSYPFTITVVMGSKKSGWMQRTIYVEYLGPDESLNWNNTVEVTQLVHEGYAYASVGVPLLGVYSVTVWDNKLGYKHDLIFTDSVAVSYTIPSPWVYVPPWP